jgi:hypothetical protein
MLHNNFLFLPQLESQICLYSQKFHLARKLMFKMCNFIHFIVEQTFWIPHILSVLGLSILLDVAVESFSISSSAILSKCFCLCFCTYWLYVQFLLNMLILNMIQYNASVSCTSVFHSTDHCFGWHTHKVVASCCFPLPSALLQTGYSAAGSWVRPVRNTQGAPRHKSTCHRMQLFSGDGVSYPPITWATGCKHPRLSLQLFCHRTRSKVGSPITICLTVLTHCSVSPADPGTAVSRNVLLFFGAR